MKSYEMVETLSSKAHVSLEQAKDALEHSNWDILDAAIYIERHRGAPDVPPGHPGAPGPAYFVSGGQNAPGSYATPGFGRPGPFDPRTDFNKPHGGGFPPPGAVPPPGFVPPYKDFPNGGKGAPGYGTPNGGAPQYRQPQFESEPLGEFVGKLAGMLENVVNHIFRASFVVRRHEKVILSIPILIFLILLIAFIWCAVPLLVLGIAFDCKYSIGVDPRTTQPVTDFIDQTFSNAERAKENIMNETQNVRAAYEQTKKEFTEDFKKGKSSVTIDLTKHDDSPKA